MIPSAVTDLFSRIAEMQAPPPAANRFASMLQPVAAAAAASSPANASAIAAETSRAADTSTSVAQQATVVARAVSPPLIAAGALPSGAAAWVEPIKAAADRNGVDPKLLTALVWTESAFHPDAVSSAGAIGLGQLMPATAASLGVDPADPTQNLDGAARMLANLQRQFGSNDLALAAYNAGPNAVQRAITSGGAVPGAGYAATVLSRYGALGGPPSESA